MLITWIKGYLDVTKIFLPAAAVFQFCGINDNLASVPSDDNLTSASSDVTRELVRMWLRHADYSMLCNV